jgi:adenosine deaminase
LRYERPFDEFLAHLRFGYSFLNTPTAYAVVARDYARQAIDNGVCYAELQINLAVINTWSMDLIEVLEAIKEEVEDLSDLITFRFVIDLPWQFRPELFLIALERPDRLKTLGVRAVSMGGDERLANPRDVAPIFEKARGAGFKTLCHAGETTDEGFAREIVQELKPERITHAVALASWVESLGTGSPGIDVCLSSNMQLEVVAGLKHHPLERWMRAGVRCSLATDDPAIFATSLKNEYRLALRAYPQFNTAPEHLRATWLALALDTEAAREALDRPPRSDR